MIPADFHFALNFFKAQLGPAVYMYIRVASFRSRKKRDARSCPVTRIVFSAAFSAEYDDSLVELCVEAGGRGNRCKREDRLINSPCPLPVTLARVSLVS